MPGLNGNFAKESWPDSAEPNGRDLNDYGHSIKFWGGQVNAQGNNLINLGQFTFNPAGYFNGGVGFGAPCAIHQVRVYGVGQAYPGLQDGGNSGAALYVQDSGTGAGNGGSFVLGAGSGKFACVKGYLTNSAGNSQGDIVFATRRTSGATNLVEAMRIISSGLVQWSNVPTYASNALASGAGLAVGTQYTDGSGNMKVVY